MKRLFPLMVLGIASCGPSAPTPPAPPVPEVKVTVEEPKTEPVAVTPTPTPKAVPTAIIEPVALAKPVAEALRPTVAPLIEPKVKAARPRSSDIERGDLPSAKPIASAVPLPPRARKSPLPSPPNEGVSSRVGEGSEMNWRDAKFPESPAVKSPPRPEPTAADVPRLGYPVPDRIPVDDPTAEISTARIVNSVILAPTIAAPFVRLLLPDPFEFAEQVKATPAAEFATVPVLVPMARP